MPTLRFILKHQDRSRAFELDMGKEALVGRSVEAQFFLCAPSVSRRHCVLRSTSRGLELEDVSTRKDCYVNGRRVVAPVLLEDGCVLQLGGLTFSVGFPVRVAASCSGCGQPCQPAALQAGADGVAVCPRCFAERLGADRAPIEEVVRQQGFRPLEQFAGPPTMFTAESGIGKVVDIVVVPLGGGQQAEALAHVRTQARLLARLSHEGILPLFDIREPPGFLLLIMGHQDGTTLAQQVATSGPLDARRALAVVRACLAAIAHAHDHGVHHRDLRPDHVLLTPAGGVVVKGFAIASELSALSLSLSGAGGSAQVAFLAPELFSSGETMTAQVDVYGAGAVLCYALTGRPPYPELSPAEFVWNLGLGSPPKPALDGVPAALALVIERMVGLDARQRPPSARAALTELDAVAAALDQTTRGRIEGDYQGDELIEFLQLIDFHQKTGTLEVRAGPVSGQLRFHRGALADAETAGKTGIAAVRRLLAHRQGRFVFTPRDVKDVPSGLQLKVGAMLLDLARKIDESGDGWSALAAE